MDTSSKLVVLAERTPLIETTRLAGFLPRGSRFYMKWEGNNPTHTHKDRAAFAHASRAAEQGFETLTAGTCGNLGASLAYFAREFGLKAVIFVPSSYVNARVEEMARYGARVMKVDGSYEDAVEASVRAARVNGWYDANPGSVNDGVALDGYGEIAFEIVEQLGQAPDVVAVPVGNGTTLAGIYHGFMRMFRMGEISKVPVMVGGTTAYGNQVLASWVKNKREPVNLGKKNVVETFINEPLVAVKSFNVKEALEAIYGTGGAVYGFEDYELVYYTHLVSKLEKVRPLPASTSAILAAIEYAKNSHLEGIYVSVITGGMPI